MCVCVCVCACVCMCMCVYVCSGGEQTVSGEVRRSVDGQQSRPQAEEGDHVPALEYGGRETWQGTGVWSCQVSLGLL